ncbi:MAG: hypothetical protein Q8Q03_03090, partial [bacterium]|nr:hypothetical protein [bacterium]
FSWLPSYAALLIEALAINPIELLLASSLHQKYVATPVEDLVLSMIPVLFLWSHSHPFIF